MSARYTIHQVDSFTKERFLGNPAGVVLNAEGLTADDMQRVARELKSNFEPQGCGIPASR